MSMASILPAVLGIGGSALGALGSSGKQGQVQSSQQSKSTQTTDMTQTPTEPGYFDQFRQSLIPQYQSMMRKAQQPIYGDAQKAGVINDANSIFNTGMSGLRSQMSAGGRLRSGAMESAGMGMGISRAGGISNFFSQLPANEQAAQWAKMSPLLQAGMGFAGRAPVGQTTKGTVNTEGSMQGTQTQYGPSWMQNFSQGLGGMLMGGGLTGGLTDWMNNRSANNAGLTAGMNMPSGWNNAWDTPWASPSNSADWYSQIGNHGGL